MQEVSKTVESVLSQLKKDFKTQQPNKTIENYLIIMENDPFIKGKIRFNELTCSPERADLGTKWTDADDSIVKCYIEKTYNLRNKDCYYDAFNIVLAKYRYNPITSMIDMIKWDGKPRIDTILQKYLKCEDDEYTKEVARLIFGGGIIRAYQPGSKFDLMPVLMGTQGNGKSTFVRWLALNDAYFREISTIEGQPGMEALEGGWICEMSELLALTKTKEVEGIKAYVTRLSDSYRRPFERRISTNPRRCIFIGTTNKTEFLTDKSGNRRYLPLKVNISGYEFFAQEKEIKEDIAQCWAEAKYYYDKGEIKVTPAKELLKMVNDRQQEVVEEDWREGLIGAYLERNSTVCVLELWENALRQEKECTRKDSNIIVSIMANMKDYERKTTPRRYTKNGKDYGNQRIWVRKAKLEPIEDPDLPF